MSLTNNCQLSKGCIPTVSKHNTKSADHHCFLSCVVSNARSLKNKLSELHYMLYAQGPDIIFVTETWLYEGFPDRLLDPRDSYNILRHDRTDGRGGGVCIFISKHLTFVPVVTKEAENLEVVAVDIIVNRAKCRFVNVYRRPSSCPEDVVYARNLVNYLQKVSAVAWTTIVVGYLNCPTIDWSSLSCSRHYSRLRLRLWLRAVGNRTNERKQHSRCRVDQQHLHYV